MNQALYAHMNNKRKMKKKRKRKAQVWMDSLLNSTRPLNNYHPAPQTIL
jgi:hypothetical protein